MWEEDVTEAEAAFEITPSWIVGLVVFVIVGISLIVEKLLHYIGLWIQNSHKKHLYESVQKIKDELMLMGFISLVFAVFQSKVQRWCIPEGIDTVWLPCVEHKTATTTHYNQINSSGVLFNRGRRLSTNDDSVPKCPKGKVLFLSVEVLHDLHYFIFILAVVHVVACTMTCLLGEVQIRQWRKWEIAVRKKFELSEGNKNKVIDIRSLTFIRNRFEGVDAHKRNYVSSFLKHLCGIVTEADYAAMRFGFIHTHCDGNQKFNFHRYIVYTYEDDFEQVVSISWFLWLLVVLSMSLNVAGWHIYLWVTTSALFLLLVIGTKLQNVITELATFVAQRHTVIVGDMSIKPSDEYFWFNRPRIILHFIHTVIFLNSYSIAIFFWLLFQFGYHSCMMGPLKYVYPKFFMMLAIQAICSYSTLPLYAIVTQMGDSYNEEAKSRPDCWSSPIPPVTGEPTDEPPAAAEDVEMASK